MLPYPAGHAEILADNYLSLWGRPLQFSTFNLVANDDARLPTLRALRLWDRVSLFDGNDTHFGFVARKVWRYGKITDVRLTMMEDFTEGGDISIPFRLPFEWTFPNIAALDMFFGRASTLNNQGAWADEASGSTPTNNTGPTANNALAFCHTETTGGNRGDHEDNGILTLDDEVFRVVRNRDVVFRYAAYGSFAAGDGLVVQGRTVQVGTVRDLITIDPPTQFFQSRLIRINLSDLTDVTSPYGPIGELAVGLDEPFAFDIASNGDGLALNFVTGANTALWRINMDDLDDETGDYGLAGDLPSDLGVGSGMAVRSDGNIYVASTAGLWLISPQDPSLATGIFGFLGDFHPIVATNERIGGLTLYDNGDLLLVVHSTTGHASSALRINPANPGDDTGDYGRLGLIYQASTVQFIDGVAFDNNGDAIAISRVTRNIYRFNPTDAADAGAGYGLVATYPDVLLARGLTDATREIQNFGAWTDIATLPASTYPAGNLSEGDTDTDVEGDDYTVAADGGWRDVTVSIPTTYQEIRLRPNLNSGGLESRQDIALRSIRSAGGSQPPPPPTPAAAFDWRFDTLIALETYFTVMTGSSDGQWEFESTGSTGSGSTGPAPNNNDPFVHTEASSNNGEASMEINSPAVALTDANDVLHDRDIVIRYAFTSNVSSTTRALLFQGRAAGETAWTTIATLYSWAYAASLEDGDTVADINGDDFTVALDGGWRDTTVSTGDYDEYQLFVDYDGSSLRQDMALHSIRSA